MAGIKPGEVLLIAAKVPPFPGLPSILPVDTGVLVLSADDTPFPAMKPEGPPEGGGQGPGDHDESPGRPQGAVVAGQKYLAQRRYPHDLLPARHAAALAAA